MARAGAVPIARAIDVHNAGSIAFTIPFNAPAPLPADDPGVIVARADPAGLRQLRSPSYPS